MDNVFSSLNINSLLLIPGILLGYTVHELGHALTAYFLGDHSQVEYRKITLNPLEHISWFGSFAFIFLGIGWPKVMQVNPHNLKHRNRDMFLVAISGPLASFTLSLVGGLITLTLAAILIYLSGATTNQVMTLFIPLTTEAFPQTINLQAVLMAFTGYIATTSLILTFMSLLPFPGQDGFIALASLIALYRGRNSSATSEIPESVETTQLMTNRQKRQNNIAEIHFNIGNEYQQEEKYDDAIARYRQAINNDQEFGPAYINMALAYLAKNEQRNAIHALRGATQFADDEESQTEAWRQLQRLEQEDTPFDFAEDQNETETIGSQTWIETNARPNWEGVVLGSGLLLLSSLVLYGYLVSQLLEMLQT